MLAVKRLKLETLLNKIRLLSEKNKAGTITNIEIDKLITSSHKLDVLLNKDNAYPREYFTDVFEDKLSKLIQDADEILKKKN